MRAPVINFSDHIVNDELALFLCSNLDGAESCDAQLLQAANVKYLNMNTVCAEDDSCINIYDEPMETVASSATLIDGNNIHCLKCNKIVGTRMGSLIVFDLTKVKEMMIYSFSMLVSKLLDKVFSENVFLNA